MIQCPECGKEIADDSAHCGYCGASIETGSGKKTMIGFAAVSGDALQQAAEEAKAAREAAKQAADDASGGVGDQPSEGKLKIPKPSISKPSSAPGGGGGGGGGIGGKKLNIPKPGQGAPAQDQGGGGSGEAPPDAKTAVMAPVGQDDAPDDNFGPPGPPQGDDGGISSGAPTPVGGTPSAGQPSAAPTTQEEPVGGSFDGGHDIADTNPDGFTHDFDGATAPTDPPGVSTPEMPGAEETMPEVEPPHAGGGPTAFGDAGGEASDGPTEFGNAPLQTADNTLPEKKTNPMIFVGLALGAMFLLCCVASTLYSIWPML